MRLLVAVLLLSAAPAVAQTVDWGRYKDLQQLVQPPPPLLQGQTIKPTAPVFTVKPSPNMSAPPAAPVQSGRPYPIPPAIGQNRK